MNRVVEADENGSIYLPREVSHSNPNARYAVEHAAADQIVLRRLKDQKPLWETATPGQRVEHFRRWTEELRMYPTSPSLSDESLRRENIYE